ncbi:hypothetical protein BC831DRAFT_448211 [Entophlyctis helioformis]|nr:hypothetical protein BC831DRAFT_448211 [Entophlyctis helioformis]
MPIYYAQQLAAQVKPFLGAHTGHVQKSLCQKQLQLLLDGRFSQNMTTGIRKLQAQVVRWSINSEDATPEKFQEHIIKCGVASQLYIAAARLYLRHGRAVVLQAAIELVFHPECRKHRERGSAHCRLSGCHIDSLSGLEFDQHDVMKARAHLKKFVQHNDIFRFSRETNDQTAMADFYKNGFQFK